MMDAVARDMRRDWPSRAGRLVQLDEFEAGDRAQYGLCRFHDPVPSRFGKTAAKRPFTGDQVVCSSRDQARHRSLSIPDLGVATSGN
jgi:hypothetical protein